ncbi:MAG TPA: ATP-grasp domain-containing protein [Candidatus Saccharimonadales bacterium]|nr:ATP-grasp domain-containing protein [Candidatus Saccharimonadales bacterium]
MSGGAEKSGPSTTEPGIVLFLGMVRRGEFETLEKRGLRLGILVDTNSKARLGDVSQFVVVERFDFSRPLPELIAAVRGIETRFGIACLFNVIEFYVAQTAEVAAALGLPGISAASARLCLDKNLMRRRFRDRIGPDSVAKFHDIHSEAELVKFANELGYPCFLQPSNVSASMWATRNNSQETLLANYRVMLDEVPKYYERLGKKEARLSVVLAEYMEGANISIDCLMDHWGRVYTTPAVEVLTGRDVGIDDFHHFARVLPPRLSAEEKLALDRLAIAGVQALDMTTSAAHVEFIGSRLGEIAARPGGNRPRILELAYGMDVLHACYQIFRGEIPDLHGELNLAAAVVTPFAPRNGILRSIHHLDEIPELPGYLYHEVRGQIGQPIGLSKSGYRAGLYIELVSADAELVRDSVNQIALWTDLYVLD